PALGAFLPVAAPEEGDPLARARRPAAARLLLREAHRVLRGAQVRRDAGHAPDGLLPAPGGRLRPDLRLRLRLVDRALPLPGGSRLLLRRRVARAPPAAAHELLPGVRAAAELPERREDPSEQEPDLLRPHRGADRGLSRRADRRDDAQPPRDDPE